MCAMNKAWHQSLVFISAPRYKHITLLTIYSKFTLLDPKCKATLDHFYQLCVC